jgi:hypothetical protein
VTLDLGTDRRVDQLHVWLPESLASQSILLESSDDAGPLPAAHIWKPVVVRQKPLPGRAVTRTQLIDEMKKSKTLHVVVQDIPSLRFLVSFFEQGGEAGGFRRLAAFGNYRVYAVRDD